MMKTTKKIGFTLVEVVVGTTFFALVLVSVFGAYSQSFSSFTSTRDLNRINQTLQYQMESIRGMVWEDFLALEESSSIGVNEHGIPTADESSVPYDWKSFSLTQFIVEEESDHYRVELNAEWKNSKGYSFNNVMKTWISKEGLNDYYTQSTN